MCSHRSPRGDGRCSKEESIPLFVLFVLFGQAKRTLKEKNHNVTFPLSYFSMTKSTKSHQRERSPLFENSSPCLGDANQRTACIGSFPACTSLSQQVVRGKYVRQRGRAKVGGFAAPHSFNYTTRANISHEKAEQIRARIACTPAERELLIGKSLFK